ncbi:HMP-PP phosphatase [Pantoea sp. BAV 3049]|uniref:HMP-PP phosphatase n=1 Tax=Pantoea sp. BAV 3049 TaxID=2654188 RepID=UPI00131DF56E|nr:HMP-PP phosphatase [Pantoea sp. BAV 3049]
MARLAAFDMDGTLLMPDHQLGTTTIRALHALAERGVILAFATGRHWQEMQPLIAGLQLSAYLISGNGTRVHDQQGNLLAGTDLSPEVAEQVIHTRWDTTASLHVFNDDGWLTQDDVPEVLHAHQMSGFRYQLTDLKRLPAHQVTKICFIADHEELCQLQGQLRDALGDRAHFCFSARHCLEVMPVGCNKGSALAALTASLDLSLAECMAFGDAMNDREMLESVGRGFIMGNAMSQLKALLPHLPVIGHCETQGVSHYLNHWLTNPNLAYSPEY